MKRILLYTVCGLAMLTMFNSCHIYNKYHRPDVDVGHGRRKEDVYGLGESRFDTQGPDLRRRFRCRSCRNLYRRDCGDDQGQINKVSFHFTAVLKSIIADGWL